MSRIRTVKPSFLRHEQLQDLEVANPGMYIMLTFQGLWTLCDSKGRFEYKPRSIKLDVLPFIPYDNVKTLDILVDNEFIIPYEVDGLRYGFIPTFNEHQRISGKELSDGEKYPGIPINEEKEQGSNCEATVKQPVAQEGKGVQEREKEWKGEYTRDVFFENSVLKFFGFSEMPFHNQQQKILAECCRAQFFKNELVFFKKQCIDYKNYIELIGLNFKKNFFDFLGKQSECFQDGFWRSENWEQKIKERQSSSSNGKGVIPIMQADQIKIERIRKNE